jgi:hypothetical protein
MIAIIGLLVLIAAAGVAVAGVMTNSGSAHPLGDTFVIFGQSLTGLSTAKQDLRHLMPRWPLGPSCS